MSKAEELLDLGAQEYRKRNYQAAQTYYEKAAALGNAQAACNLGYIYEFGRTGKKDPEKAFTYYKQAAEQDNAQACYKIGDAYLHSDFIEKDPNKVYYYYEKALNIAQSSNGADDDIKSDILYRLALCYYYGIGTDKNYLTALEFINNAQVYSYYDAFNHKFMWKPVATKVKNLREKIILALDKELND